MKLYVARHGETDWNAQGRYACSTDVALNERGIAQAKELAQTLSCLSFDVVVSSPLMRALHTAAIVCENRGTEPVIVEEFAERGLGVYEGLTREEAMRRYPDLWARNCTRHADDAPTGGETIRAFDERVARGLDRLKAAYPDLCILLMCHGFTARAIHRRLMGLPFEEMHGFTLGNCEVSTYAL